MSVIFDQLRISDDGKNLFIDVHVNSERYFDNMYIDRITICTEEQVSETHPKTYGSKFVYQGSICCNMPCKHNRKISMVLSKADLDKAFNNTSSGKPVRKGPIATEPLEGGFSRHMLFVYLECGGIPAPDTPCGLDEFVTLGVTYDYGLLYYNAMRLTRELADKCRAPTGFIDFILNYNALKVAVETDHYVPAVKFWKSLQEFTHGGRSTKHCGCHG